ncbi:MAG: hypothetical protein NTV89_06125 [Proteobacteria bacterium]|nr:hypothetical protein [Pseudomonadota bacterium]
MPNVLIRDISSATLDKLKTAAKKRNRSLQQELKELIEHTAQHAAADVVGTAMAIREKLRKKQIRHSDSGKLLREDRNR